MNDLDVRVRRAFDDVKAPESVKMRTLARLAAVADAPAPAFSVAASAPTVAPTSTAARRARPRILSFRRAAAALAACLVVAALGVGGFAFAQPTAYVGIDVNPSIELGVNRFDIVVKAEALNSDGDDLLGAVPLAGRSYADALALLTQSDAFAPYAQEGSYVEISVTSDDDRQAQGIQAQSDACLSALPCRGSCHAVDEETREAAASAGMGVGRYRTACELMELDPSVTLDECAAMTMRELRDRIAALEQPADASGELGKSEPGAGRGHGPRDGSGHGHGAHAK